MPRYSLKHPAGFVLALAVGASSAFAADLIKADNGSNLRTAGTYAAPNDTVAASTSSDWVIFNSTFANTTSAIALGGGVSMAGLRVVDPGNNVTVSLGNATLTIGTSGASGAIDLSSATKNFTIGGSTGSSGVVRLRGSAPSITVNSGVTFTLNASVSAYDGGSINVSGAGVVNVSGVVSNGNTGTTRAVYTGTNTLTLGGVNTYTGGTSVSVGTVAISQNFTMSGANAIGVNAGTGTHGEITFGGTALTLGGSLQLDLSGTFAAGGTFDLIDLGSGATGGDFSSVSVAGSYAASLTNNGSGVWSGTTGGVTFSFNQASGDLTVSLSSVPEPSTFALLAGGVGMGTALTLRRRRG